jgi:AcrR family transcriptional regulator
MSEYSKGERTRLALIEATGELAAELGFSNVSTRAVAERSGENIGTIHYHFGGKDGLFRAVVKAAMADCIEAPAWQAAADLEASEATPEKLSAVIRDMVHRHIRMAFGPDKPHWHSQVIYQLLRRDDALYELFRKAVLEPDLAAMRKLFRLVEPDMSDEETFLRMIMLKMPIFSHANYRPAILKSLGVEVYSEGYLQKMEDLLVQQTQLALGLPFDKQVPTPVG